ACVVVSASKCRERPWSYEQTLSEVTQLLPEEKELACPTFPWPEISGFRNILVHNYLGDIDPMTVASIIDKHLKPLEECIRAMLPPVRLTVKCM
ncbi:MAG: HepT-like ribonuclease domain-containing protein, partial [Gammaproteobacteria bacterium]